MQPLKLNLRLAVILPVLILSACFWWWSTSYFYRPQAPIRIGVLHSLTGTMAMSEIPLIDAVRLAVKEINASGGLLGRPLEIVLADGQSNPEVFAKEALRLIVDEKVSVLFGCWTSSARKAVKAVVEQQQHLLFYPLQYEGLEQSPHIIYTGSVPNQQLIPGTRWAMENLGKRVYLLGSDYIFPRVAGLIIKDFVKAGGGEIVAERYIPLGSTDFSGIIKEIAELKPDVILNTINGDSVLAFFTRLHLSPAKNTPVMSFSIAEHEIAQHPELAQGNHYAVWSYFQAINNPINNHFVAVFGQLQTELGKPKPHVTSDPIEAAYFGVHLWARAVTEANSPDPERVNVSILRQSYHAPSSIVSIDKNTRHTWKMLRIAKVQSNGQFKELENSEYPLRPEPYPAYRSKNAWQQLLERLP